MKISNCPGLSVTLVFTPPVFLAVSHRPSTANDHLLSPSSLAIQIFAPTSSLLRMISPSVSSLSLKNRPGSDFRTSWSSIAYFRDCKRAQTDLSIHPLDNPSGCLWTHLDSFCIGHMEICVVPDGFQFPCADGILIEDLYHWYDATIWTKTHPCHR